MHFHEDLLIPMILIRRRIVPWLFNVQSSCEDHLFIWSSLFLLSVYLIMYWFLEGKLYVSRYWELQAKVEVWFFSVFFFTRHTASLYAPSQRREKNHQTAQLWWQLAKVSSMQKCSVQSDGLHVVISVTRGKRYCVYV